MAAKLKGGEIIDITFCVGRKRTDQYTKGGWPYTAPRHWHKAFSYDNLYHPKEKEYEEWKKQVMQDFEKYLDEEINLPKIMTET